MKLEEIEAKFCQHRTFYPDDISPFINTYFEKLLKVAKEAKRVWLYQDMLCDDHELVLALKELEKECR